MKICYIANLGNNVHFARWYKFFLDRGHEVHVISGDSSHIEDIIEVPGVHVHYLSERKCNNHVLNFGLNLIRLPFIMKELRNLLNEISPDVVHAHQIYPEGFWAALSGFHPFIVTPIGSDLLVHAYQYRVFKYISKYVQKRADLITCDSICLRDSIYKFGGMPEKTHLVFNGVDLRAFKQSGNGLSDRIRKKHDIGDSPMILSVRNLDALYNISSIVLSIPKVLRAIPDAKFVFCYIPSARNTLDLKKLINNLGIEPSVRLIGMVSREDIPYYYAASDVCISVPSSDSSPSSVYEAMSCGTPVIISDLPWTKHFMRNGENALFVPPKDHDAIAERILEIMTNRYIRDKLIKEALLTVSQYVDYHKNMGLMENLMMKVINN